MPRVGRPVHPVFESAGHIAVGCVVEFVTTDARCFKFKRADKLVAIGGLPLDETGWYLEEQDIARVGQQRLEHDAPERLVACVCKRNSVRGVYCCGGAADGFIAAYVCGCTHFGVEGAVCIHHEHARWVFGSGVESVAQKAREVPAYMSSSV